MEKSISLRQKMKQLFKKFKKWMTVDVKQGVIGLGEAVNNNNNTNKGDSMPKPSYPITIRKSRSFNKVNYHPKDLDTVEFDPSDCYLIDEWEEEDEIAEKDPQATDSSAFKIGSAQGLPEFVFDSPKVSGLSKGNGEVQVIKFSVKSSLSSKSRRLKSKRRSKSLDDCIRVTLYQHIEKQYYFNCLDLLLYARFYLEDETTMIVPILAIGEASSQLKQGVDNKLMEMSIHYLFKIPAFNLKSFLDSGEFDHYGQCQCFQIGYCSKIVVLSFNRGYNITYNKEDMLHVF